MSSPKSVVIGIPSMDTVHTSFASSLANMLMHTVSCDLGNFTNCSVQFFGSSVLPFSRQVLAQYALGMNFTHLLFIDSDMQFPHDMLVRFMQRDEQIIGINALSRRPPYRCTAQEAPGVQIRTGADSTGLQKVHRTGFGVMWIATEVFRRMSDPWFDFQYQPEFRVFKGEDYLFCEKARDLGYDIWIDHDLSKEVEHIGNFGFTPQLYDALQLQDQPTPQKGNGVELRPS